MAPQFPAGCQLVWPRARASCQSRAVLGIGAASGECGDPRMAGGVWGSQGGGGFQSPSGPAVCAPFPTGGPGVELRWGPPGPVPWTWQRVCHRDRDGDREQLRGQQRRLLPRLQSQQCGTRVHLPPWLRVGPGPEDVHRCELAPRGRPEMPKLPLVPPVLLSAPGRGWSEGGPGKGQGTTQPSAQHPHPIGRQGPAASSALGSAPQAGRGAQSTEVGEGPPFTGRPCLQPCSRWDSPGACVLCVCVRMCLCLRRTRVQGLWWWLGPCALVAWERQSAGGGCLVPFGLLCPYRLGRLCGCAVLLAGLHQHPGRVRV